MKFKLFVLFILVMFMLIGCQLIGLDEVEFEVVDNCIICEIVYININDQVDCEFVNEGVIEVMYFIEEVEVDIDFVQDFVELEVIVNLWVCVSNQFQFEILDNKCIVIQCDWYLKYLVYMEWVFKCVKFFLYYIV